MTEPNDDAFAYDPTVAPHDLPTAKQLLEAVRIWIEDELGPELEGRMKFHARVAANVLGTVEREIELGPGQRASHAQRLEELGVMDEVDLANRIAAGDFDDRRDELKSVLMETVRDKLLVANPRYLTKL